MCASYSQLARPTQSGSRYSKSDLGRFIKLACCVLFVASGPTVVAQGFESSRPLWQLLQPGPYEIGFRVINHVDSSRDERVVRLAVWYPAVASINPDEVMFGDYLVYTPPFVPDNEYEEFRNAADAESLSRQFFGDEAESHQVALMDAVIPVEFDAREVDEPFPLILHSLGRNGNQFQHTVLWEYLASHGYVVGVVAQFGLDMGTPEMEFEASDLQLQLEDMRSALRALSAHPQVDSTQVGIVGYSSGALVGLWLASQEPQVLGVIGLDGSINRAEGRELFLRVVGDSVVSAPFLNICRWPHDEYDSDRFAQPLEGDVIRIGYERAIHFDFQNWPSYQVFAGTEEARSLEIRSLDEARRLFESTALFTRLFLDANLKDDPAARRELLNSNAVFEGSGRTATLTVLQLAN